MENERLPARPFRLLLHVPVPWVFVLTYLLGAALERAWPTRPEVDLAPRLILVGGALVFAAGAGLAAWGWGTFRRAATTTVPGRSSSRLVTWGPYRFSRNPMYVGLAIAYLGEAGILRQVWPVVLLPLVVGYLNWVVIPLEERKLGETFGVAYDEYRVRVHRWF